MKFNLNMIIISILIITFTHHYPIDCTMISNSTDVNVDPPPPPESRHPLSRLTCKCKQGRCSDCHHCKRCGCTCISDISNRSCRKLRVPNINTSKQTSTTTPNSKPTKKRGRPPRATKGIYSNPQYMFHIPVIQYHLIQQ